MWSSTEKPDPKYTTAYIRKQDLETDNESIPKDEEEDGILSKDLLLPIKARRATLKHELLPMSIKSKEEERTFKQEAENKLAEDTPKVVQALIDGAKEAVKEEQRAFKNEQGAVCSNVSTRVKSKAAKSELISCN
jgi:hypothetical protein